MVMNVYRQIDRNQMQFDFLIKEHVLDGYEQEIKAMGGNIICVPGPKKIGVLRYIAQVRRVLLDHSAYCAVHSHVNVISGLIMLAAFLAGIKNRVAHSHSTKFQYPYAVTVLGKILILFFATQRVACGQEAGKALFGTQKYTVIPNGIDTQKYIINSAQERENAQSRLQFEKNRLHICHVGRFADVKNHRFILEIVEQLNRLGYMCIVHLLGDGDLLDNIKKLASDRQLDNVIFYGNVSNVSDYMKASDVFIMPSKYEGVPLAVIEAQCAGLMCYLSENVPNEVDLGIGCIEYLPLEVDRWVDRIASCFVKQLPKVKHDDLIDAINKSEFDIHSSSKKMLALY